MKILTLIAAIFLAANTVSAQETAMQDTHLEKATFAGGCFWCMQPFFDNTKGVVKTTVGGRGTHFCPACQRAPRRRRPARA